MAFLSEISIGTAILAIFAVCVTFFFLRGMMRLFVNIVFLGVSCFAGFKVWQNAPTLALNFSDNPPEFVVTWLPAAAGILTYILLKKLLGTLRRPILNDDGDEEEPQRSLFFRGVLITFTLCIMLFIGATVIHHLAAVEEIESTASQEQAADPSWISSMGKVIKQWMPDSVLNIIDPMTAEPRMELAKTIASLLGNGKEESSSADPALNKLRHSLQELLKEKRYSTFLRHPGLSDALKDKKILQFLTEENSQAF